MKNIHLYIGNQEVEFSSPPDILYTYQQDDLTNPTIVKNSFSKTITIEGTPSNNQIFGQYWNVERLQGSGGNGEGVYFNASKKAPFTLYIDHDIYETGYAKLDTINTLNKTIQYEISLYGGLGDFFYNLSINTDGDQLKLSDLTYTENGDESEFDFTTNIDTVKEAWDSLQNGTDNKWRYINFMPAYNGFPEDFNSDKIIINTDGTSLRKTVSDGNNTYITRDGFVRGQLPDNMTEWEVRDLRSYLQRPCIRMKEVINACCNPDNNGGYNVVLDPDFFNSGNPYWEKTWLSLSMVQNLEYTNEEQIMEGATLLSQPCSGSATEYIYQDLEFSLGEFSQSIPSSINVNGKISVGNNAYRYTSFAWFWNSGGDSFHSGWWCLGSLFCQLIALNGDTVVGASNVYNLTSPIRHNGKLYYGNQDRYDGGHKFTPYMDKPISNILGTFENGYFTAENTNTPSELSFTITNLQSNVTDLKMVYYWGATENKLKKHGANYLYDSIKDSGWLNMSVGTASVNIAYMNIENTSSNIQAVLGGSLGRTGTKITKSLLLNTENSPCEYLLSYTKMFGLYYVKDVCDNTIYIYTRNTFYNRGDIVNLNNLIDKGKDITINPLSFNTKWYQFKQNADETQFYNNYLFKRGVEYGSKILNTGYEFNSEKEQLLEDNVIMSGVEGLEKSKYFTAYNNDNTIRPWFGYGLTYELYNGDDVYEYTASTRNAGTVNGINEEENMKYFDLFPKVQFHDSSNNTTDGKNCLLFFSGFKSVTQNRSNPLSYYLTDDTPAQTQLNDGTPCWLFTTKEYHNNTRIAYKISDIPVFERYLTTETSGKIDRSLDFGTAQELFIPSYNITEDSNIYSNFWKTYLEDLYDVNTKVLKCFAKVEGKPNPEWLRRFYWFNNSIWRLNKIIDWNVSSYDTTQMEFVKVQDVSNYTSVTQLGEESILLLSDKYNIPATGDTATLTVVVSDGGAWRIITTSVGIALSSTSGTGNTTITASFSQNNTGSVKPFYLTAIDSNGNTSRIYISQTYIGNVSVTPSYDTLVVPASGGSYEVDFIWYNQGNNYITSYTSVGDVSMTVDVVSGQEENKADITIGTNVDESTISSLLTFWGGGYEATVGIDQLPNIVEYDATGGTYTLVLNYASGVTFSGVPYWITITDNGDRTYTVTANNNLYSEIRRYSIVVVNGSNRAEFVVQQSAGGITPQNINYVSPANLYFEYTGGTQYISVRLTNPWIASISGSFFTLSTEQGDGISIIGVSCGENSNGTLSGTITITDLLTGEYYVVVISQAGSSSPSSINISPTSTNVPSEGGFYMVTINYTNRNGDIVTISGDITDDLISWGTISWTGDTGQVAVRVNENTSTSAITHFVTFNSSLSPISSYFAQNAASANASVDLSIIAASPSGSTHSNGVTANVNWTANVSDSWISVTPSSGASGYTSITITTSANTTTSLRSGTVDIVDSDTAIQYATITVNQGGSAESISVSPSSINFSSTGGTATINIVSNTDWTITEN